MHRLNWQTGFWPQSSMICSNDGDDDKDKGGAITEEKVKEIVNSTVNSAITNHLKRHDTQMDAKLGTLKDDLTGSITEALKGVTGGSGDDDKSKKGGKEPDPEVEDLRARTKDMEAKLAAKDKREKENEAKRIKTEEKGALTEALVKAGVPKERLRGAVAELFLDQKRIKRHKDDADKIVMTFERDGYTDELTLDEGLKEWLATDEGKVYQPPIDAGGSGQRGGKQPPGRQPIKATRGEKLEAFGRLLMKQDPR